MKEERAKLKPNQEQPKYKTQLGVWGQFDWARQLCVNDRIKRNPNINYALINFIYLWISLCSRQFQFHFVFSLMVL